MKFSNSYLTNIEKANLLQRWIIFHSMLYYEYNESIVEDFVFDANEVQLVKLLKSMPCSERKKTKYWYAFYDFDGSTGYHLYSRLKKEDKEKLEYDVKIIFHAIKRDL